MPWQPASISSALSTEMSTAGCPKASRAKSSDENNSAGDSARKQALFLLQEKAPTPSHFLLINGKILLNVIERQYQKESNEDCWLVACGASQGTHAHQHLVCLSQPILTMGQGKGGKRRENGNIKATRNSPACAVCTGGTQFLCCAQKFCRAIIN